MIKIKAFTDDRGFFTEAYKKSDYGMLPDFVQDNVSFSVKGTIRGMHFQRSNPQGKLIRVLSGRAIDCVVDLRKKSRTFGQTETFVLEPTTHAVYIPPGFAHGFWAYCDTVFHYKCTTEYDAASDGGISPIDPDMNYPWELDQSSDLIISSKDKTLPLFRDFDTPFD